MKIDILTLFPNMFNGFKDESIIKRAIDSKKVDINTINFRDFATNKHKKVDDTPYGGGSGMVLMCQPIFDAINSVKKENSKVILLSPQGKKYNQKKAYELSKEEHLILICGHYEGFDERIKSIVEKSTEPLNHDEEEIAGYRDALSLIHSNYENLSFSQKDILMLHEVLLNYTGFDYDKSRSINIRIFITRLYTNHLFGGKRTITTTFLLSAIFS